MTSSSERVIRRVALCLVAMFATPLTMVPRSALAAPSASDLDTARALRKEGKKLRAEKDFAGALVKYRAAFALVPTPVTGMDVAQCYVDLGKLVEARGQAIAVVEMPKESDETEVSQRARDDAKKLAADLVTRIPTLRVKLVDAPSGTTPYVSIDDESVPSAALSVGRKVNPGKHVVTATADGSTPIREEIVLGEGDDKEVALMFKAVVPSVTQPPEAAPPETVAPPKTPPATVAPPVAAPTEPRASGTSILVPIGISIGAAGLLIGTITGVKALSLASDVKRQCAGTTCPRSAQSTYDSAQSYATVSTISFVLAAGGAALTIVGLATGGSGAPARDAAIRPTVGLGWIGVDGSF